MFKVNKWHKGQSGKGYVVELCFFDENTEEWHNTKLYVPDAAQYAGAEDKPAALAGVGKDGALVIKCYRKDNYVGNPKATQEELPDPSRNGKAQKKAKQQETDGEIPF